MLRNYRLVPFDVIDKSFAVELEIFLPLMET